MTASGLRELQAPPGCERLHFISDLHLQPGQPATFAAWARYMAAAQADAIFILGDLFEAWVGDDAALAPGFEADCAVVLRQASARMPVFFMHGNRDFLLGEDFAIATGLQLLHDPAVLTFRERRVLLSHGDALCVDDVDYQRFRAEVRQPQWQARLLAEPLDKRRALARHLRERSEARASTGLPYADVDADLALQWLRRADAPVLVHGHTHRPGTHLLAPGFERLVLSDWDLEDSHPRAEVLQLDAGGFHRLAPG